MGIIRGISRWGVPGKKTAMLSAWNQSGEDVLAEEVDLVDGPFYCPACREQLILKQGRKVAAHFAHWPDSDCEYTNEGESEEHRLAKREIRQALLQAPGVTDVRLEHYLHEVRPDVSFIVNGQLVALEIQLSQLSPEKVEERTKAYARRNIAVLWMPLFSMDLLERRYAPKDWERYLHTMYYGKVYYWYEGLLVQPVKFEEYLLEPNYWTGKRYPAKRFVTPTLLPQRSILDLVPRWRGSWRDIPRAKLWCEPWEGR